MVYFTSDLHLGHPGIIKIKQRPFSSVQEMNEFLIKNYNSVVRKTDKVYLLGDLCHYLPVEQASRMIAQLNGRKILIRGNHDKKYEPQLFEEIHDFATASFQGTCFVMMHYPMLAWPKERKGSIQLHGHLHESQEYNLLNRELGILRYDVGVDANQFYPVSVNQIVHFFFGDKESVGEPSPDKQKGRKKLTPGKPPGIRQV